VRAIRLNRERTRAEVEVSYGTVEDQELRTPVQGPFFKLKLDRPSGQKRVVPHHVRSETLPLWPSIRPFSRAAFSACTKAE